MDDISVPQAGYMRAGKHVFFWSVVCDLPICVERPDSAVNPIGPEIPAVAEIPAYYFPEIPT
jgi:hypothetical protein